MAARQVARGATGIGLSLYSVLMSSILLAACGEATAPNSQLTVDPKANGSIIRMPISPHFHEQLRYTLLGLRAPNTVDACLFDRTVHLKQGQHAFERIVEFNVASCAFIIARGTDDRYMSANLGTEAGSRVPPVASLSLQTVTDTLTSSGSGSLVRPSGFEQPIAATILAYNPVFFMNMLHEDPIGLEVTGSEHTLKLFTSSNCINSALSIHQPRWVCHFGVGASCTFAWMDWPFL